jgi:hypothetical protein
VCGGGVVRPVAFAAACACARARAAAVSARSARSRAGRLSRHAAAAAAGNFPTVTRVLLAKIPPMDGKMSYVYDKARDTRVLY